MQYLAGHENSGITMDIYAHLKYNRPEDLAAKINRAFAGKAAEGQLKPDNSGVKG